MANVFKNVTEVNNKVNKSTFDLSFQNNLTMQFGYLYPCFVKKFAPGTKVKIKPTFGLNFMPMMFPVQTRMRARMSFYKVRCRSLWKDYKDWFGNLKPNLVKPYIDFNSEDKLKKMASTGSLGDYLGLPTTFPGGDFGNPNALPAPADTQTLQVLANPFTSDISASDYPSSIISALSSTGSVKDLTNRRDVSNLAFYYIPRSNPSFNKVTIDYTINLNLYNDFDSIDWDSIKSAVNSWAPVFTTVYYLNQSNLTTPLDASIITDSPSIFTWNITDTVKTLRVYFQFEVPSAHSSDELFVSFPCCLLRTSVSNPLKLITFAHYDSSAIGNMLLLGTQVQNVGFSSWQIIAGQDNLSWNSTYTSDDWQPETGVRDIDLDSSPYFNSTSVNKDKQLMIDASFFRAYESIYNAYFRDIRNNPYILNGQPEYNVFIPSDAGGADDNVYELRRRNWESDFLTTAVPSPQQGRAPLVGITTYDDTTSLAFTTEDGKKYAVNYDYDPEAGEMKNVSFQQLGDDAVVKEARNMMDLVASGISISDLRNVNAYTKFLELNMRKGYFYKDLVEGHFDTKVRYDELNMPEFIGGTAKDVFVNPVSQTVQTSQDGSYFGALGSYAGQASVQGSADNTISAYFDEECIVIGLISVVPVANYSQLLPKHFLHRELLDSYFPEFDNIGFQPIFYDEVCPIQAFNDNPDSLKDIFGYQRPWYDYVASTDEVHGLFRTNLRNFLINRVFASKPTLSPDFLLVDPEQVNDVFSVTQTTDKILGQIYFDVKVNAPISRIAIPRLD